MSDESLFDVDLSEVDTREEIEEVIEDLAEIEDELEVESEDNEELAIPSELRSDADKSAFYKNHAKKNGLHYLGMANGKPVFKEIE